MRTTRTAIIGLLSVFLLVLAGGIAYAAVSGTSQPSHRAVTAATTVTPGSHSQHPASRADPGYQARGGDWRCCGGGWYRGWNYGYQGHASHGHQGYPGSQRRHYQHHGSQHRGWGYQGGSHGSRHWGNGSGCCGSWH